MNSSFIPPARVLVTATMAVVCALSFTQPAQAKDKHKDKSHSSSPGKSHHDDHDHDRQVYSSHPRSSFTLSLGTGYAGRGYYYGPPNSSYYYERLEVRYYATREAAPRAYYSHESYRSNSGDAGVQRALAGRGYYQGAIDGEPGQSMPASARYKADHGLRVTGAVSSSLLRSLGL